MRFNFATGRDAEVAKEVKNLYKGVVARLTSLVADGGWEDLPPSFTFPDRERNLTWTLSGTPGPPCPDCSCDLVTYEPAGDGAIFDFCVTCWVMRGVEPAGDVRFDVCQAFEKELHDLPPGWTMSFPTGDGKVPLSPPQPGMTPEERRTAFERFKEEARAPLQVGRQWWLGRMATEGMPPMEQDYPEARRWLEMAAARGHGKSILLLGFLALRGLGEPRCPEKAAALCLRAAARGDAKAWASMGRLLWDGAGVPRDRTAALDYWRRASERGDDEAELWLGQALFQGTGVEPHRMEGLALIREAAEHGNGQAQEYLGDLLVEGRLVRLDDTEGRKWLWKAAAQGLAGAKEKIGRMTEGRNG